MHSAIQIEKRINITWGLYASSSSTNKLQYCLFWTIYKKNMFFSNEIISHIFLFLSHLRWNVVRLLECKRLRVYLDIFLLIIPKRYFNGAHVCEQCFKSLNRVFIIILFMIIYFRCMHDINLDYWKFNKCKEVTVCFLCYSFYFGKKCYTSPGNVSFSTRLRDHMKKMSCFNLK